MTMYTFLSVWLDVNRYIPIVYHLFPCYRLFLVGVNYFKCILFISRSKPYQRLYYVYVCSQFDLNSKSLQTCFFVQGFFLLDLNSSYNRILLALPCLDTITLLCLNLSPATWELGMPFFLWNCPIQDEGLSIRQHVIE